MVFVCTNPKFCLQGTRQKGCDIHKQCEVVKKYSLVIRKGRSNFTGTVLLQVRPPREKSSICCSAGRKGGQNESVYNADENAILCKVRRCGEKHVFLEPATRGANSLSKAFPVAIHSKLELDFIRSALGFYSIQRVSILLLFNIFFYVHNLRHLHFANRRIHFKWQTILKMFLKAFLFQWASSMHVIHTLMQELHFTPFKIVISRNDARKQGHTGTVEEATARLHVHHNENSLYLLVPRSFAVALATWYRIPVSVNRSLLKQESVYPLVDSRGRWYVGKACSSSVSRMPPIWKYRISDLEQMETEKLYQIMVDCGISCSKENTHQELINKLIPLMGQLQQRCIRVSRELMKRKLYSSMVMRRLVRKKVKENTSASNWMSSHQYYFP